MLIDLFLIVPYKHHHVEGIRNVAYYSAHAEGNSTKALGDGAHAEGHNTEANGNYSHAEGTSTKAHGLYSHAEGQESETNGIASHSEGKQNFANGHYSHAEGCDNTATASAYSAHIEGLSNRAEGPASHVGGGYSKSSEDATYGFAHGQGAFSNALGQAALGNYNVGKTNTLLEVGNATNDSNRSNAFEVYKDGHAEVQTANTSNDKAVITLEALKKFLVVSTA